MAASSPGKSAWSDTEKPLSKPRRRRTPRSIIQPEAIATLDSPKSLSHELPSTLGGAMTSARPSPTRRAPAGTRSIDGNRTPLAR